MLLSGGCCDRGLQMPLWGRVNEGSACTTREAILFSLALAPPGGRAADRVGRSSAESSATKPDGEGTGLAVWTSHRQTDGVLVHLRCPSPGGRVEEVAWWGDEEETQLAEGRPAQKPPALPVLQPLGLPYPLAWTYQPDGGPAAAPRPSVAEQVRQVSLRMGCTALASRGEVLRSARKQSLSPSSSAWDQPDEWNCPGKSGPHPTQVKSG